MSTDAPTLDAYVHQTTIPTRLSDNDIYGHVNNVVYYSYFDTVINAWLIAEGGLDMAAGKVIGVCAESHCAYHGSLTYPEVVEVGLRVGHLGNSSVRYEIGLFAQDDPKPRATGWFVHVFVDRDSRRPVKPIPAPLRDALERLQP